MGKSQKKRAARRHNPVRVPDSHLPKGLEAAAATSSRKDAILPIIQKLESVDAQERTWACSAVSNLIQNDPSTRRLLQGKNVVGALITRLTDSVEEVVVEASGALRNLCIDGGYDICAEMYNKNILAPLQTFVPKISNALHQLVTAPKSAPDHISQLVYGLAENVITLIWCLSETSNKALTAINGIRLVSFLMAFLEHRDKLPSRTVAAAAQCLYVLTDDDQPTIDELRSNSSYTSCLLSVTQIDSAPNLTSFESQDLVADRLISLKLLASGILRNISPIPAPSAASAVDVDRTLILPLVIPILSSIPLAEASERVIELLKKQEEEPKNEEMRPSLKKTPKSDHKSPEERELEKIEMRLRNVQLGLEVLTGVCATLPDPETVPGADDGVEEDADIDDEEEEDDEEEDPSGDGDDVEMNDNEPKFELKANSSAPPSSAPSFLPTILPSLLPLLQPTPLSFPPIISTTSSATTAPPQPTHPPTTSALSAIHISTLECLNNACLALSLSLSLSQSQNVAKSQAPRPDVQDGHHLWNAIWSALRTVGLEGGRGQERRREMWEVAVGVLWGIGGIWKRSIVPDEEQVKLLMQLCDASTDPQVKVKCIGALDCLAQYPDSIEANRVISTYLLQIASTPPSPSSSSHSVEPILQATSSLIDIYSDESSPYDTNFRHPSSPFLPTLSTSVLENVRRAVRSIGKKGSKTSPGGKGRGGGGAGERELKKWGEEVLLNLRAFVKYRRALKI